MNTTDLLSNIRVASPCSARWADMTGDARTRHCAQCRKNVYNLSDMTTGEVARLLREKEGKLCVRFHRRRDGTMLTADCPVGASRVSRRLKRLLLAAVPLVVAAAVVNHWACGNPHGSSGQTQRKLSLVWDEAVWKVKGWLGIQSRVTMGEMCPLPAPTPPPQSPDGEEDK